MTDEPASLWPHHLAVLVDRAVATDVIAERGYWSVPTKAALKPIGFGGATPAPALVIPLRGVTGDAIGYQVRPDEPRWKGKRLLKFEVPYGSETRIDVNPRARERLADPTIPLWITEGIPKGDALVSAGVPAIALLGVWNWSGTALADFEYLRAKGRTILVAFDSDVMLKTSVHDVLARLGRLLTARGADVAYVYLPDGPDGRKQGVDDYLAAGGTLAALLERYTTTEVRRPAWQPAPEAQADADRYADVDDEPGWRVLNATRAFLTRFVRFTSGHQAVVVVLWIAHTHAFDAADSTPRLNIKSAEKQSGKTRLLELSAMLCPRARHTSSISAAAVYRMIEASQPTLLIDEADAIWKGNTDLAEALRGVVNAGHRRGATVVRCVGEGTGITVAEFPVFAVVAIAGIGSLPDTIADRSVVIDLQRRRPGDHVEPLRDRFHRPEAAKLALRLGAWTTRHLDDLRAVPDMPPGLVDRAADVWEPLLAIADAAGGDWPSLARVAAVESNQTRVESDGSIGVQLLADLRDLFTSEGTDRLASATIVEKLNANEERDWGGWHRGAGFTKRDLVRLLKPFGVAPKVIRIQAATARGYRLDDMADAFERYLATPATTSTPSGDVTPDTGVTHLISDVTPVTPVTSPDPGESTHAPDRPRRRQW